MSEKLCIFCRKLNMEHQMMGSEWTGAYGEDGFSCGARHFDEYGDGKTDTGDDMRALFLRAETCPDYDPADGRSLAATGRKE